MRLWFECDNTTQHKFVLIALHSWNKTTAKVFASVFWGVYIQGVAYRKVSIYRIMAKSWKWLPLEANLLCLANWKDIGNVGGNIQRPWERRPTFQRVISQIKVDIQKNFQFGYLRASQTDGQTAKLLFLLRRNARLQ